jgi:Spy/CpxP family protein refolding chaperone
MKRNWLVCLVVFSLALNLGGVITFAYLRYQNGAVANQRQTSPPLGLRKLSAALDLDQEQRRTIEGFMSEHHRRFSSLRMAMAPKRQELLEELSREPPVWNVIEAKLMELRDLQRKLEEEVLKFCLEIQRHLKPEQKIIFLAYMECRMFPGTSGKGRSCNIGLRSRPGKGLGSGRPGVEPASPQ